MFNPFVIVIIFAVLFVFGAGFYTKDLAVAAGVLLGAVLALINLFLLTKIVVKMLDQGYKRKVVPVVLLIIKVGLMAGVFLLAFKVYKVAAWTFALGYLSLPVGILVSGFCPKRSGT